MFFFESSLAYIPKINFPLSSYQINYAVRHYFLQFKEQLYFEKWYRVHKKHSLKLVNYNSNFNKGVK